MFISPIDTTVAVVRLLLFGVGLMIGPFAAQSLCHVGELSGPSVPIEHYLIEISFVDDTVIPYSVVYGRLTITNVTAHEVPIPDPSLGGNAFQCQVHDGTGGPAPVRVPHFDGGPLFAGTLAPGETVVRHSYWTDLLWGFTCPSPNTLAGSNLTLIVQLSPLAFSGLDSSNSTISTTLHVADPEGSDQDATRDFLAAYMYFEEGEYELSRSSFDDILATYEESDIIERALLVSYFLEHRVLSKNEPKNLQLKNLTYELAVRCPDSPLLLTWGRHLRDNFEGPVFDSLVVLMSRDKSSQPYLNILLSDEE